MNAQKNNKTAENEAQHYSQSVLVPIANPQTAGTLLRIALSMVDPEEGVIKAVNISLGDTEKQAESSEELKNTIGDLNEENKVQIAFEAIVATSISRGILDEARAQGADVIVLGIQQSRQGEVEIGTVVENVIETAPCDVIVYRAARVDETFNRVVIPVKRIPEARIAAQFGMYLAQAEDCKIEAIRTQPGSFSQFEGLAAIEQAIREIPNQRKIKRTVVTAHNDVKALLTRTNEDDLIVVGFSARAELESWMFGDMARALLEQAEGPVIMVTHSEENGESSASRVGRRILSWFRPTLTRTEQDEIVRQSARNARLNIDYIALILVSATIATFGLLLNSSAVIIGAMLVAPLISPLIALSTGVTVGRVRVAGRALIVLGVGVMLSLLVAWLAGTLLPALPTDEMVSRGRPTVLDAIVALASGAIGAYATARKDIPAALAGVAIAAALMPPLCVVGLGFALGETALATGALLLFLTNIICIIISGTLVFLYLGMTLRRYDDVTLRAQLVAIVLLILVAIPVGIELFNLTQQVNLERDLRDAVVNQLPAEAELTDLSFDRSSTSELKRITVTIRTAQNYTPTDFQAIEADIADRFDQSIELAIVTMPVLRIPVNPDNPPQ